MMRFCTKCGAQNEEDAVFCTACGAALKQKEQKAAAAKQSRTAAPPGLRHAFRPPPAYFLRLLFSPAYPSLFSSPKAFPVSSSLCSFFIRFSITIGETGIFGKAHRQDAPRALRILP